MEIGIVEWTSMRKPARFYSSIALLYAWMKSIRCLERREDYPETSRSCLQPPQERFEIASERGYGRFLSNSFLFTKY
jgi:hypothetical protein